MRLLKFIKVLWRMSGRIPWVDEAEWELEDSNALRLFLCTRSGKKLRMILLNSVIRQNAHAVEQKKELEFEAGFANGMRTTVHTLEVLAREINEPSEFTTDVYGAEHLSSKGSNGTTGRSGASFGRF